MKTKKFDVPLRKSELRAFIDENFYPPVSVSLLDAINKVQQSIYSSLNIKRFMMYLPTTHNVFLLNILRINYK